MTRDIPPGKLLFPPLLDKVRQDRRRTSSERLEKLREQVNDMLHQAAREPENAAMQALARWGARLLTTLDGEF